MKTKLATIKTPRSKETAMVAIANMTHEQAMDQIQQKLKDVANLIIETHLLAEACGGLDCALAKAIDKSYGRVALAHDMASGTL